MVLGGYDGEKVLNSCEEFNPLSNKWSSLPVMNFQRMYSASYSKNSKVFVFGGIDHNEQVLSSIEVFDSKQWSMHEYKEISEHAIKRFNHSVVNLL